MLLSRLAEGLDTAGGDRDVSAITEDSRRVIPGGAFIAIVGAADDGHRYVDDAVARGATAIVTERPVRVPADVATVRVPDARTALAIMAARFYGHPARELDLVGFTGTFGKTSTSDVLRVVLASAGRRPGVLGSLGARYGAFSDPGRGLTTPAAVELHAALRGLRDAGAETVIMEVTSHALRAQRVRGLTFDGGLLAAIRPGEHTDFHRTYEDYVDAKRLFLDYLAPGATLAYDGDNRVARELAASRSGPSAAFSLEGREADLTFHEIALDAGGARFTLSGRLIPGRLEMRSALLGSGHLRNVALALTYAFAHGVDPSAAVDVLRTLQPLRRRMERYQAAGRNVLDDTAAHPVSFRATFAVASLIPHERLAVVYAIRGNRGVDINARNAAVLAELTAEHRADTLIVTSSSDATGPSDRVTPDELAATTNALTSRGRPFITLDRLTDAIAAAFERTSASDLIVLAGAQGMNEGKRVALSL